MLAFQLSRPVFEGNHQEQITIKYEVDAPDQATALKTILDLYADEYEWLGFSIDMLLFIEFKRERCSTCLTYQGLGSHKQLNMEMSRVGIHNFREIRIIMRNIIAEQLIEVMQKDLEDYELWS